MNGVFKKLASEINFKISPSFEFVEVVSAELIEGNIFEMDLKSREIIPFNEMLKFLFALNNNFKYRTKFVLNVEWVNYDKKEIKNYLNWIIQKSLKKSHLATIVDDSFFEIKDTIAKVTLPSITQVRMVDEIKEDINRIMRKFGFKYFDILPILNDSGEDILELEKKRDKEKSSLAMERISSRKVETPVTSFRRKNEYVKKLIKDLDESHDNNVLVEGEIFNIRDIETKSGYLIREISIADSSGAVYSKLFGKSAEQQKRNAEFKVGQYVSIKGQHQLDIYSKEAVILINTITKMGNPTSKRIDDAPKKRIELNVKTKMSAMDGIIAPNDLIERAREWGHSAIAIVDKGSVQSFPDFYNASKNDVDFKPIFGASFEVIDRNHNAIINPLEKNLKDDSYVVFDLETTSLSPIFGEIIEFGAVKVVDGKIVDRKEFFVKPKTKISEFTTKLTGITDRHLVDAKDESEAIKDIAEYLKGFTLVAHNAKFDISYVNEKLDKYGFEILTEPVIDSMIVARILNPKANSVRLGKVASKMEVSYDGDVAHRANYDAEVLSKIWLKMISSLEELNIKTHHELFDYKNENIYSSAFGDDLSILVKNQEGLKELFQLSSIALTNQHYKNPRLFFEDIKSKNNLLIGSGGISSRLLNKLFFGTTKQVEEEIKLYDYIEVQPLDNFKHLINRGMAKENIVKGIKHIIEVAEENNIPVVATSDARYLDLGDKIYHEVYINAKGLKGVRHYLYKYNEEYPEYPDQYLRTTEEMIESFTFLEDARLIKEIVIDNTHLISDMIEKVVVIKDGLFTPEAGDSAIQLKKLSYDTARDIYGEMLPEIVEKRLEKELGSVIKHGFAIIYWISHLLVTKSIEDGYLVGSRGSVGSSFVATMTSITEVNPLCPHYVCGNCKYSEFFANSTLNSGFDLPDKICPKCNLDLKKDGQNIPFETFLGFNADKVPDIDLNFSGDYQANIHNEVKRLFGDSHSFRAGTISTVAEKTAIGYVRAWVEETSKMISKPYIEYIAKGVTGTKRTTGQHPGGIIVIPKKYDVEDFCPINYPANDTGSSWKTTHFDFHAIHDNVLKLDLLGHDDPTAIKYLEKLTGVDAKTIPFFDKNVLSLFSSTKALSITPDDIVGETTGAMGIPEFGTHFVRGMLKSTTVTSFGDLISISGLSHGTNVWQNNAESIIKNQNKTLAETISCRDDILIDLTAKNVEPILAFQIMEKVRKGKGVNEEEIKVMKENGVEDWYIDSLQKIKYMFPKAHATAYVMMAWRIAWFKVYHPLAYYAAYFTTRADYIEIETMSSSKKNIVSRIRELQSREFVRGENALTPKEKSMIPILEITNEMYARGLKIKNIDLEKSEASDWIIDKGDSSLIPPFSVIDGLGDAVAESIISARKDGAFISKKDITNRTQLNKTSMKKLEDLKVLDKIPDTNQITFDLF